MKEKFIVQSNKSSLYEEFLKEDEARKCAEEHECECPYIEKVSYSDDYNDYIEDPNYITHTMSCDGTDTDVIYDENEPEKQKSSIENANQAELDLDSIQQRYVECYKNYCKATYGEDYNLDEALSKEEYKNDGLGHVFLKCGCPPSQLKKYLKQSIDKKEISKND